MKISIDSSKCQGHGRCYALAPTLFESDDDGYSKLRISGDIPADCERDAGLAVANCPEFAISTVD